MSGSAEESEADSDSEAPSSDDASPSAARPSKCGRLRTGGARLVDAAGNPTQLRGFSTHGLAWSPQYVNAEAFAELSRWGANVARLALYTHENGGYCTDGDQAELHELIERGVRCAADADMYAIIDWHVLQELDPNVYLDQAKEFWDWASARFADSENVLYEICNEPNGSTTWADIKRCAETVIPVIRANDANVVILVGTPNWPQQPDSAAAPQRNARLGTLRPSQGGQFYAMQKVGCPGTSASLQIVPGRPVLRGHGKRCTRREAPMARPRPHS